MRYRRSRTPGGTFFFTVATQRRRKILCMEGNVRLLRQAFREVKARHPFTIEAFVLLPDHIHCVWTLPPDDRDFSTRWMLIKCRFSRGCKGPAAAQISASRVRKRESGVWQRRFWEHEIRSERDLAAHVEYIHFNPVKHAFVKSPADWPYSSFHRYVRDGIYERDWGADGPVVFDKGIGHE